jgi:hypothetical protein
MSCTDDSVGNGDDGDDDVKGKKCSVAAVPA